MYFGFEPITCGMCSRSGYHYAVTPNRTIFLLISTIFDRLFFNEFRKLCMNVNFCHQLAGIPSTEPGVVNFKVESLQCRVGLNQQHLQSLHIKVSPLPDHKEQWSAEEMQVRKVLPRLLSFYSLLMWSEMYLK
jgi:hypothetical protein